MTRIAPRSPQAVIFAAPPSEPKLSPTVAHAVAAHLAPVTGAGQFGRDDPGHYVAPPAVSPAEWQGAQYAADQFDEMLAPVTADVLAAWLMPVNAASRNPQAPADFAMRVAGIFEMVADLPAAAFTAETRRKLVTGFFPSHEDVRAAVEPVAEVWRRKRNALRSLRKIEAPRVIAAEEPTPDKREQAAARALAVAQELRAGAITRRPEPAKPLPLHPAHLLAAYEAEAAKGNRAAASRASALRRALGAEA